MQNESDGVEAVQGTIVVTTIHKAKGLEWDNVLVLGMSSAAVRR